MNMISGKFSRTLMFLLLVFVAQASKLAAQDVIVSYQTFYDELSPYGQWVADPEYGDVWVPNEEPGYRPYATRGHWVMTEYGNMWMSDVPWGWACYHYGRWTYNPYYGWVWIPGHEWAPAWVSWRSGGGYYGWAPMGPGYYPGGLSYYPDNYWVFVGPQYLYHPNVYSYYEPQYNTVYINRTTYINETYVDNSRHTTYYYGPRQQEIESATHQPVQVYRMAEASGPRESGINGNSVSVYRPSVQRNTGGTTSRPTNVVKAAQPIGKPQAISTAHANTLPDFHQVMQQRNPQFKTPNTYNNAATNRAAPNSATPGETPNPNRPGAQHVASPVAPKNEMLNEPADGRPVNPHSLPGTGGTVIPRGQQVRAPEPAQQPSTIPVGQPGKPSEPGQRGTPANQEPTNGQQPRNTGGRWNEEPSRPAPQQGNNQPSRQPNNEPAQRNPQPQPARQAPAQQPRPAQGGNPQRPAAPVQQPTKKH